MANNITTLPQCGTYAGSNTVQSGGGGGTTTPIKTGGQLWPRGDRQ